MGASASGTGRMPCRRRGSIPIVSASFQSAFFETYAEYDEQFARRLRVELRIGAQEVEELRHRAGEARLLLGRLHLGLDARDLFQADVVDLLRRQRQRGELLDLRLVEGLAVRHRRRRERRARLRQVLAAHHRQQPRVRRRDDVADHRGRFGAHRLLVGRGDRRGHLRERRVQRVGRVALHVRLDRLVASDDRHARDGVAAREPGPHVGDLLVEVARHVAEAAEIGAIGARPSRSPGAA